MEMTFNDNQSKQKQAFKNDMEKLLKKHNVPNIKMHMDQMEGAGFFDIVKKGIDMGIKAYNFYDKHKDTINDIAGVAAPLAKDLIKKIRGGKLSNSINKMEDDVSYTMDDIKDARGGGLVEHLLSQYKNAGDYSKYMKEANTVGGKLKKPKKEGVKKAPSAWVERVRNYAAKNGVTYKQAMMALKGK